MADEYDFSGLNEEVFGKEPKVERKTGTSYDGRDVASYIAQQCEKRMIYYTNVKVQMLLYCVYGMLLAWDGTAICDERPVCHQTGPVFPGVYDHMEKGGQIVSFSDKIEEGNDDRLKLTVGRMLDAFGPYSAMALCRWGRHRDSPWEKAKGESGVPDGSPLSDGEIADFFRREVIDYERSGIPTDDSIFAASKEA